VDDLRVVYRRQVRARALGQLDGSLFNADRIADALQVI
jgi:hypothetical protein